MATKSLRDELSQRLGFPLDPFQLKAIDIIDAGESVVVSAPTGSGKTVVAEYAIMSAIARAKRVFYTTPIKALSNQKFSDLAAMFGRDHVGLLTGDNVVNSEAPILVMTTEVLRNMLYARSSSLEEVVFVILDEVHFIQDAYRGPVWEEVIIHLSHAIQLVCLSATVSNTPEVAEWMTTVRGATKFVVEDRRPVELESLVMIGEKSGEEHLLPVLGPSGINPQLQRLVANVRYTRHTRKTSGQRTLVTPRRIDVVDLLRSQDLLPTIFFIFSRKGCDDAAISVARDIHGLTTPEQQSRISDILDDKVRDLDVHDLDALGYTGFRERLLAGIASHHAGLIPSFKEAVEVCFSEGLIKVVFATETLAVGINMPARSVVIEKLTKFTGEHHEFLSAAQYTQLTGRAGRRGLDDKGHAILLWTPFVSVEQMAGLVASRTFRLTSSFRATYNMAVNLVKSYPRDQARHLLNLSLAQFQSDRSVVKLEARLENKIQQMREYESMLHSAHGSVEEYLALADDERQSRIKSKKRDDVEKVLSTLRPGSVIHVDKGRFRGRGVVLATTTRAAGWKVSVLTESRALIQMTNDDFSEIPHPLATIDLPQPFVPTRKDFQRKVIERMSRSVRKGRNGDTSLRKTDAGASRYDVRDHDENPLSVALGSDPDLAERLDCARNVHRLRREIASIQSQVDEHASSISRTFDRVLTLLETWGYVESWSLTNKGTVLSQTFHECDLLIAECLHSGVLDDLEAATLAAMASVFVYEHRSSDPAPAPWFPSSEAKKRWRTIEATSSRLRQEETASHLLPHRTPDPTYVSVAYAWAVGEDFGDVIEDEELSGGDFVRNVKQIVDILRQISLIAPNVATRKEAHRAIDLMLRGVIAASSSLTEGVD